MMQTGAAQPGERTASIGEIHPEEKVIVDRIFSAVMEQRLAPRTKLAEATLCRTFGVGRMRVRRALLLLGSQGIVELHSNRGAYVACPSPEEAREVFEARRIIVMTNQFGTNEFIEWCRLVETEPLLFGGHMIDRVYRDHSTWAATPAKFEAGTGPIAQAIAFGTAIDFVTGIGFDAMHAHERQLAGYAHRRLNEIPGMRIYGPALEHKGAIVSFTIDGAHPEDLAQLLDRRGVFVRHGHHCTMPLHDLLGVSATVRASFGVYNTLADVDALIDALNFALGRLRLA